MCPRQLPFARDRPRAKVGHPFLINNSTEPARFRTAGRTRHVYCGRQRLAAKRGPPRDSASNRCYMSSRRKESM
jgi:hypothetical protein